MNEMTKAELAAMIDHTFLKPAGEPDAVEKLCAEAKKHKFACAMVHPAEVSNAVKYLGRSKIRVGTVIGFPLGQNTVEIKIAEGVACVAAGAKDIDLVVNIRRLKEAAVSKDARQALLADLRSFVKQVRVKDDLCLKLIIECCCLNRKEKILACKLAKLARFDFVKTSTGFGPGGATIEDVKLLRKTVGPDMGVKAAGGIRTRADALAMIEAGANRIGTSAGVAILVK